MAGSAKRGWPLALPAVVRRHRHAGIDRDHAGLVGQQRIDVELADLGHVGRQLRQLHQDERDAPSSAAGTSR